MPPSPPASPTSPLSPIAPYPPPTSPSSPASQPRTRAREVYGFTAYVGTLLLFVLYVVWAVTPDAWLERIGVEWYPNREWAILVPAWTTVVVLLTYLTYLGLALSATPSFTDLTTITDTRAHILKMEGDVNPLLHYSRPDAVPHEFDIPLGTVNRVLYGKRPLSSVAPCQATIH
ncbi:PIG-P-domain-containing protein [Dacryopinax primogenitus]|uniref:PIG-P-domain-containing protein n=1 Tax=Dacryopinax primogenitus (strain DJM 731) TaxID=1858805 RepID=M5FS14_DACPD|nr:PIG-P-domain-containing protein [Dacryopinax primogenitus]EJT97899.1 PIG-P-domain-containing protein [Dacryopinax primogenitus]